MHAVPKPHFVTDGVSDQLGVTWYSVLTRVYMYSYIVLAKLGLVTVCNLFKPQGRSHGNGNECCDGHVTLGDGGDLSSGEYGHAAVGGVTSASACAGRRRSGGLEEALFVFVEGG